MKITLSTVIFIITVFLDLNVSYSAPIFLWPSGNREVAPPLLTWNVLNKTSGVQKGYADKSIIKEQWGAGYRVTLTANDIEGLKSITLQPEAAWTCVATSGEENIAQKMMPAYPAQQNTFGLNSGGSVATASLVKGWDFNFSCNQGYRFSSGTVKLHGQASNHFEGTTASTIQFNISPRANL